MPSSILVEDASDSVVVHKHFWIVSAYIRIIHCSIKAAAVVGVAATTLVDASDSIACKMLFSIFHFWKIKYAFTALTRLRCKIHRIRTVNVIELINLEYKPIALMFQQPVIKDLSNLLFLKAINLDCTWLTGHFIYWNRFISWRNTKYNFYHNIVSLFDSD